jgi:hypothetical protein
MRDIPEAPFSRISRRSPGALALLALATLMFAAAAVAAPPAGKGGKKGGGGGAGGGPVAEQHLKWRVRMDASYSLVRPAVADDGTVYAVDVAKT